MFHTTHKIILRQDRKNADGTRAAQLQIISQRKKKVIGLGFSVADENFDEHAQKVFGMKDKKTEKTLNDAIFKANARLFDIVNYFHFGDKVASVHDISDMYLNRTLRNSVAATMALLIETEAKRFPTSLTDYKQMLEKVKSFAPNATFGDIDSDFVRKFDAYMAGNNLQVSTRGKHHKNFKKFLALARNSGVRFADPYINFKVSRPRGSRIALLSSELDALVAMFAARSLPDNEHEALRCFLWSCGTGMRYMDVKVLTHSSFIADKLEFMPRKTRNLRIRVVFPLGPNLLALVESKTGNVFRVIDNGMLNRHLKAVRRKAGIKSPMSFHVARHTFATLFLENGGSPEVCMELMGISKWETIKIYIHLAESRKRKANHAYDARFAALATMNAPAVI